MNDEKDLLRTFRVPGAPPDPEALARGRHALVRHIADRGHRPGRRQGRRVAWATAAATVAVLVLVNVVALVGIRRGADDTPSGQLSSLAPPGPASGDAASGDAASGVAAGPVQAGRPVCPDVTTPSGGGRDIWVAVDGDDSRTGATAAEALADPQEAVDRARPGDRVLLSSGTYTSRRSAVVEIARDGAPGKAIVLTAAPGARPVIRTGTENWYAIRVTGSYVVVSGLTVQGHRSATDLRTATALVDENDARTGGNGIVIGADVDAERFPHDVVVRHNVVQDLPGAGIAAQRTGSVTIECNAVSGNAKLSPFGNSGISVTDSRSVAPGGDVIVVQRNVVHDNDSLVPRRGSGADPASRSVQTGHGISCDGNEGSVWQGRLRVEDNLTYANGGAGINIRKCDRVRVRGNTSARNVTRAGSTLAEVTVGESSDVELVDNLLAPARPTRGISAPGPVTVGENVVATDPGVFVDPQAGDYRPRCDGPAAGAAGEGLPRDLFGATRPADRAADAGAVESC